MSRPVSRAEVRDACCADSCCSYLDRYWCNAAGHHVRSADPDIAQRKVQLFSTKLTYSSTSFVLKTIFFLVLFENLVGFTRILWVPVDILETNLNSLGFCRPSSQFLTIRKRKHDRKWIYPLTARKKPVRQQCHSQKRKWGRWLMCWWWGNLHSGHQSTLSWPDWCTGTFPVTVYIQKILQC